MRKILLLLAAALVVGCGPDGPKLVDVTGTITLDGSPLPDGKVYFVSPNGAAPAVADVAEGKFTLKAPADSYRVEVRAFKERIPWPGEPHDKLINYIPDRYNIESQLKADVREDGANEFTFAL